MTAIGDSRRDPVHPQCRIGVLPSTTQAQTFASSQARPEIVAFYNAGNDAIELINLATSSDWTSCGGNDACKSRDQVGASIAALQKAVPDLKWEIKELLASGDPVIVRGEASGTPTERFMGLPPQGTSFRVMSIDLHTI